MSGEGRPSRLGAFLERHVARVQRHAVLVLALALGTAVPAGVHAALRLGVDTDTAEMLSEDLPFRRSHEELKRAFPQFADTILVVIDAPTPAAAREAARELADALAADEELFSSVRAPSADPFLRRNGLLYLERSELEELAAALGRARPLLRALAEEPSLARFAGLLSAAASGGAVGLDLELDPVLARTAVVVRGASGGEPPALDWSGLLGARSELDSERQVVVVQPRLDYAALAPAGEAMDAIRRTARELGLGPERGVRVRITGEAALISEELESVRKGMLAAGALSLVGVGTILLVSLRSVRLVAASLVTLLVGLAWTASFAALAVGRLNLISIAFAVLYIGLGIDAAVHYGLRFRELRARGEENGSAARSAAADVGASLVLCALTTALAFLAFVPTDFDGVSELGQISSVGMLLSLVATLTVLPALLAVAPPPAPARAPATGPITARLQAFPLRHARPILAVAGLLLAAACTTFGRAEFDHNPIHLRDPAAESVAAFEDLLADPLTTPWRIHYVAGDAAEARRVAAELEELEEVAAALRLADLVPADQAEKLEVLRGIEPPPELAEAPGEIDVAATRDALASLRDRLAAEGGGASEELALALGRYLAGEPDAASLERLESALLGPLAGVLASLRAGLEAGPFGADDLPAELRRRWVAPDGRRLVEVLPAGNVGVNEVQERFVDRVRALAPEATGGPVMSREGGRAVVRAFQVAFAWALGGIGVLLLVLLRRPSECLLVCVPLLVAAALCVAASVVLRIPFNFANVITLPLLLGIGVDSGIHMVHRRRHLAGDPSELLSSSTSRAVLVSALTTLVSFGSLSISPHPGTASMGHMLALGIGLVLLCALLVLPALFGVLRR